MTSYRLADDGGFTLVEVLVAFVILAGAIILSFQVFADGLRRLTSAEARMKAVGIARSEVARLSVSGSISEGIQTGTTGGVAWKITVRPMNGSAVNGVSEVQPFRVEVRVIDGRNKAGEMPVIDTIVLGRRTQP